MDAGNAAEKQDEQAQYISEMFQLSFPLSLNMVNRPQKQGGFDSPTIRLNIPKEYVNLGQIESRISVV